ncbi:MAG: EpsG family protein [Chlorobiaceae bacterium]|nr:EpsG family protein [Chlorobiaceae bacterium]
MSLQNGRSKYYFYSYLILLFILASFRYGVGPDYFNYEYLYSVLNTSITEQIKQLSGQELLFRLFGTTLHSFNFSYQLYLAFTALITLFYIGKLCAKYSKYPVFSLYLYYCFFYFVWVFSGIRQGLTLSIGVYYLLECMEDRKHIKFLVIVFFLTLVHASSLFLLVFYVFGNLKINRKALLIGVFICFCVSFIPAGYFLGIISHIPFGERVAFYSGGDGTEVSISYFDFKSISRFILLLIIGIVFDKSYKRDDENKKIIMDLYVISFGIYYALRFVEVLAANASLYGFVLIVIILPDMYARLRNKINSKIFLVFIIVFSITYFFKNVSSMEDMSEMKNAAVITPYTNIFNKSQYFDR